MRKFSYYLAAALAFSFLALIAWGLKTDCPDTAIYYYCGDE